MEIGKVINKWGYEWYKIAEENENTILMMKDILSAEEIKKLISSEDEIMINGSCVRYSDNIRFNEWEKSFPYKLLNGEFLKQHPDMANEIEEIRLPKKEEIENLTDFDIRKASDWYWTCTPYEDPSYKGIKRAFYVLGSGIVYRSDYVGFYSSLRPAVSVKSVNLISEEDGNKNHFVEGTIPGKIEIGKIEDEQHFELKEKINEIIDYLGSNK